jgi:hypothetical protein
MKKKASQSLSRRKVIQVRLYKKCNDTGDLPTYAETVAALLNFYVHRACTLSILKLFPLQIFFIYI